MVYQVQVNSLGEFARCGFTLEHPDDHVVLLLHEGALVDRFYQTGATPESLQAECAEHLVKYHGWDGALWSRNVNS